MAGTIHKDRLRGWMDAGLAQLGLTPEQLTQLKNHAVWDNGVDRDLADLIDQRLPGKGGQLWNLMKLYYGTRGDQVRRADVDKIGFDTSFIDTNDTPEAWNKAYTSFQWKDVSNAAEPKPGPKPAPAPAPAPTQAPPAPDNILKDIQREYLRLSGAPGNDPVYQSFINAGRSAGQLAAGGAGVASGEGLGLRGVAGAAAQATMPYMQQRQALAQSYLGLGNQRDMGLQQLSLGRDQLALQGEQMRDSMALQAQAAQNQVALANWQQQQQQSQGLGSLLGAGVGALGFLTGIPGVGEATTKMGATLGAGIGGLVGGGAGPSLGSYAPRGNYTVPGGSYRGGWS